MIVQKEEFIKTKFGLIPNDWRVKRLKELGSSIIGLTYSPKDVVDKNEGILVLRSSNIQNGRLSYKDNVYVDMEIKDKLYVKKGDLLVCARNGSKQLIGKNAYIDKDYNYSFGAFMSVFRSDYNEYIYQLFQTDMYKKQIQANLGATINQITTKDINSFQFPFPKNIKEQQKIASILSTWDKAIELKEKLIEQKKEQKKGLMQKLLTGEVRLPGFDGEWKEVQLGAIAEIYQPKTISQSEMMESGYPVYGANGLIGYYDKFNHDQWQIMITCRGSTCGTVNRTSGKAWITGNAMVVNVDNSPNVDKDFMFYLCYIQKYDRIIGGSGQPQITKKPLEDFLVTIPSNINEQKAIAEICLLVDKEILLLKKELSKIKNQKQGLMQLLLTGKVRVKV